MKTDFAEAYTTFLPKINLKISNELGNLEISKKSNCYKSLLLKIILINYIEQFASLTFASSS